MPDSIISQRVPFLERNSDKVSRDWYRFFISLYELAGGGQNSISLTDLQVGPQGDDLGDVAIALAQGLQEAPQSSEVAARLDELGSALYGLQVAPIAPAQASGYVVACNAVLDFPSTAAGAVSDLTVSAPGAVSGDIVTIGVPAASVPVIGSYFAWVSAADTVTVRYVNNSLVTSYDPASGTFRIVVRRE